MKHQGKDMHEGPEAFERFTNAMKQVLAVPHSEIKRRIEEHRAQASLNPNKRGPKTKKRKPARASASRASGAASKRA